MDTMAPEQFTIAFSDEAIADLQARLQRTRWPVDPGNLDWKYGASRAYLEQFADYWRGEYDWRVHEAAMNRYDHFRVTIDGVTIHYLYRKGVGPAPKPLILTHGWPWTFWDLAEVIDPLADPGSFGADPADAFDVVIPSLPGFCFSTPLTKTGIGVITTAKLWRRLMREVLGYEHFGAQGGDLGATVTQAMAQQSSDDLIGIHLARYRRVNGPLMPTGVVKPEDYGPGEEGHWERHHAAQPLVTSHLTVNTHDPQSMAFGINDSPVGLAAWLLSRRRNWSASKGDLESVFSREFLATNLTLYWLTECFPSSIRLYWESNYEPPIPVLKAGKLIEAPVAIGLLPDDTMVMPRRHAEEDTNLVRWTMFSHGGHFGPAEAPDDLVADLRHFFRSLR